MKLLAQNQHVKTFVDVHGNELFIKRTQDVQPILDANQRLITLEQNKKLDFRLAARIPKLTYYEWKREWNEKYSDDWEWSTFLAMRLNSRDYTKFRTEDMRI